MGLDMYLYRGEIPKTNKMIIDEENLEEVSYWRKCNQLHTWFTINVDGVDNCTYSSVTLNHCIQLVDTCKLVLTNRSTEYSQEHLPTSPGFFYGDTSYDDYYYDVVEDTINLFETMIMQTNWDTEMLWYHPWW